MNFQTEWPGFNFNATRDNSVWQPPMGFFRREPTSEAINEVHYSVCVKSSYFNEPSMTCRTSNRPTVLFFLAPNFLLPVGLFLGCGEESKIKSDRLFYNSFFSGHS